MCVRCVVNYLVCVFVSEFVKVIFNVIGFKVGWLVGEWIDFLFIFCGVVYYQVVFGVFYIGCKYVLVLMNIFGDLNGVKY